MIDKLVRNLLLTFFFCKMTSIFFFLTKILGKKKKMCYNVSKLREKEKEMLKNRLKELRARDGLNQTDLAKLAGVSRQTISLLERDEYTPSIIIALKVSQIFNETVESVFRLEEDE